MCFPCESCWARKSTSLEKKARSGLQDYGQESRANGQQEAVQSWQPWCWREDGDLMNCGRPAKLLSVWGWGADFPPAAPSIWNILLLDTCKTQPLTPLRSPLKEVLPGLSIYHGNLSHQHCLDLNQVCFLNSFHHYLTSGDYYYYYEFCIPV